MNTLSRILQASLENEIQKPLIQTGNLSVTGTANTVTTTNVSFIEEFSEAPAVFINVQTSQPNAIRVTANNITTKGFEIRLHSTWTGQYPRTTWIAIGKK